MTWRKWYALEVLAFAGLGLAVSPLSVWRALAAICLAGAACSFYRMRVNGQRAAGHRHVCD
jgi:hypothetical protein